jgi:trk system potassium uptake protein TrkA
MDIVIVGAGEVGVYLADILSREGHRVSVVDSDPAPVDKLRESLDVQAVHGDGTRAETLNGVGVSQADLFVAVTDNDLVNMLACLVARELGAKRVILRLMDPTRLAGYHFFHKRALGYDVVLSTDELAAEEILSTVREQHALEVESFADGRVQLRRLRISAASELTSDTLANLTLPNGMLVAAISRHDDFFVADGSDRLQVGDQVHLIGRTQDLDQFETLAGARRLPRRGVVIMGGGRIGVRLANELGQLPGVSVRVFERDPERAKEIAGGFPSSVMVLVGDATDIDKASYRKVFDSLHIDKAISPRLLCAKRILRFVRASSVRSIAVVAEGRGEVLEFEASFAKGKTEKKVKSLGLPKGVVVGAVVHGEDVTIPRGDTVIHAGDRLILFTLPENLEQLDQLFAPTSEPAPAS